MARHCIRTLCILIFLSSFVQGQDSLLGTWIFNSEQSTVTPSLRITYERYGNAIKCVGGGVGYVAQIDGTEYAIHGIMSGATVILRKIDDSTIERTYKKDGVPVNTAILQISPDAKFLTVTSRRITSQGLVEPLWVSLYKKISSIGNDPLLGTWERNPAKSLGNSMSALLYERHGDGIQFSADGVEFTAEMDGENFPVKGTLAADSIAIHRVDSFTIEEIWSLAGNQVAIVRRHVSRDGSVMTSFSAGVTPQGEPYRNLFVYDKHQAGDLRR